MVCVRTEFILTRSWCDRAYQHASPWAVLTSVANGCPVPVDNTRYSAALWVSAICGSLRGVYGTYNTPADGRNDVQTQLLLVLHMKALVGLFQGPWAVETICRKHLKTSVVEISRKHFKYYVNCWDTKLEVLKSGANCWYNTLKEKILSIIEILSCKCLEVMPIVEIIH